MDVDSFVPSSLHLVSEAMGGPLFSRVSVLLLLLVLVSNDVFSQSNPDDSSDDIKEVLDDLIVDNHLDEERSYRCGVFYAGDNVGDKPRLKVFIIPKRFPTDCSDPKPEEYKDFCVALVST